MHAFLPKRGMLLPQNLATEKLKTDPFFNHMIVNSESISQLRGRLTGLHSVPAFYRPLTCPRKLQPEQLQKWERVCLHKRDLLLHRKLRCADSLPCRKPSGWGSQFLWGLLAEEFCHTFNSCLVCSWRDVFCLCMALANASTWTFPQALKHT